MRTSVTLTYPTWNDKVDNNVLYLSETSNTNEVMVRSISFGEKDVELVLRTFSFKRKELEALTNLDKSIPSPKSDLLVNKECKDTMSIIEQNQKHNHKSRRELLIPKPLLLPSPRNLSELDVAATKVQKVYKSYRTRRNLADCAVVVEELWWKALDFAALSRSSVSYFNTDKHETAVSRWVRARTKAAKVGKGLLKDEKAQKLALQHWLEAIDPRHRYGHNLHFYYDIWSESKSAQPFFYWLDIGDGKECNLERCLRVNLQRQCIKYLGPKEREAYRVIVEDGKLVYEQSGMLLNTEEGSKWIFVLSTSRSLYIGQKKKGVFQHSSFLSGGATSAAGRLVANDGILEAIWPYSGHYLPTEDNFKEFISFLEEHSVDMTNVKRCAFDDDTYSSKPTDTPENEPEIQESTTEVHDVPESKKTEMGSTQEPRFDLSKRMSCKWSSGVGPRIGCVRDYPMELQSQAMEKVSLSPRNTTPGHSRSFAPIPSPRPSSRVRMSPRLAYMGLPSPRLTVPAAN